MHLYDYALSGNCYKIRLFLALLGQSCETTAVDFFPGFAHLEPNFLEINPAGTLPVLTDGDLTLCDSAAILVYLAHKYDKAGTWYPTGSASTSARIQFWLAFASRLSDTVGLARLHDMLSLPCDIEHARREGHRALRELEAHLTEQSFRGLAFLLGESPTIADIACFPYAALAPDGGIDHDDYPVLRRWLVSVRRLPGFIEMPGIHRLHDQAEDPTP
ncbi:MAG: glutathione S-transferase family protein [Pseudomonadota bacterium]